MSDVDELKSLNLPPQYKMVAKSAIICLIASIITQNEELHFNNIQLILHIKLVCKKNSKRI